MWNCEWNDEFAQWCRHVQSDAAASGVGGSATGVFPAGGLGAIPADAKVCPLSESRGGEFDV